MGAALQVTMFTGATKIVKPEGQEADEFEQSVAQELFNLEVCELGLSVSFRRFLGDEVRDAESRGFNYLTVNTNHTTHHT